MKANVQRQIILQLANALQGIISKTCCWQQTGRAVCLPTN
jgi:hypothetical protein